MSIANRREYLRQPVGRSPIDEALRAMPIGGTRSGILGAAGTGFSPADISSLAHWYDATEISGSDGDAIGTWADQEGTDDLTQATSSKKPTLRTSEINSKNALEFDGSDDILQGSWSSALSQPVQIFVVGRKRSGSTDSVEYLYDGGAQQELQLVGDSNSFGNDWTMIQGGTRLNSGVTEDTNVHLWNALFDTSNSVFRIDGDQDATGSLNAETQSGLTVGARGDGSGHGDYDVGEILVYDADLSGTDESDVEDYLNDKWAVF